MGDAINANLFLVGFAWQHGLIPISRAAIERAIELNGVSVEQNLKAFCWGRHAAHDPAGVERLATPAAVIPFAAQVARTLDEIVAKRVAELTDYQDASYAARYRGLVDRVRDVEARRVPGSSALSEAVARCYYKLLAIKDEYEVARLYARPAFRQRLEATFEGDYRLKFHLAPPLIARPDPVTGIARKREYGPWMMSAFAWLAKFKGLRGTMLDVFGHTAERRMERQLVVDYERLVDELLAKLDRGNHATAVAIASIPEEIRGYGHVKHRHVEAARARQAELLAAFRAPAAPARAA
jgi:indolepyruvate ferredoxin oxidoreductase